MRSVEAILYTDDKLEHQGARAQHLHARPTKEQWKKWISMRAESKATNKNRWSF